MFGNLCVKCKGGRNLCKLGYCPLLRKVSDMLPKISYRSKDLNGQAPPSIFIGSYGYPKVFAGPLISPNNRNIGNPENWYGMKMEDIVLKSSTLFRPSIIADVHRTGNKILEATQEIAMSIKPVDAEAILSKPYIYNNVYDKVKIDFFMHPMGPKIEMERLSLTENPSIPRKVDYVVSDTDLSAVEGSYILYQNDISISHIQRLISSGLLGVSRYRKMVPTRWAITASDDMISKMIIKELKNNSVIDKIELFYNKYIGNYFYIFLIPRVWSFEVIESWQKGSFYSSVTVGSGDFEDYDGRKDYAANVTGGYYAARLAVTEYLKKINKQASVIIYREVSSEYSIPLGVWLIRETIRDAMKKPYRVYDDIYAAIASITETVKAKEWYKNSKLLNIIKKQCTIDSFLTVTN